ncbi:hypothetical protein [Microbispora rosea]|uniref:hypothetical protein n=1 Tax=Microbispora rosea TaxID=58117 RepID=UPI00117E3313|nr:hypothetical protein [Microbispora rosea]
MIRSRRGRSTTAIVAATVLLAFPSSSGAVPAGPAGDRPIDCRDWPRPDPLTVRNVKPVYSTASGKWAGEANVTLWRGDAGPRGEWHYWATLTGRTRPGDAVWLDVWPPGGGPWHRCGPFPVARDGQKVASPMAVWRDFTLVKACARHNDSSACGRDKGAMVD